MYKQYQEIIKSQLTLHPKEWNFKGNDTYRQILEHVSVSQGEQYLNAIKRKFKNFYQTNYNTLNILCNINDKYGKTTKHKYNNFTSCSPTNLRYILHSLLILEDMKKYNLNNIDIIEIGGGYGGLCFFIHNLAPLYGINISSYSIFDLPEASILQEKYLNSLNIKNTQYCQLDNFNNLKHNSFLISNYAFSEISKDLQSEYIHKIINPYTRFGFLTWNFIPLYIFINNSIIEKQTEYPKTGGENNFYIRFYPNTQ